MDNDADATVSDRRTPLFEFLIHSVVGTAVFVIIAIPAVLLNLAVTWLERLRLSPVVLTALEVAEYTLLAFDVVLFILFLLKAARQAYVRF